MVHGSSVLRALIVLFGLGTVVISLLGPTAASSSRTSADSDTVQRWRSPTALWLAADGTLFAAGSKSGAVSVIDTENRELIAEVSLGKSLVALAATPDGRTLIACDAAADEVLLIDRNGRHVRIRERVPVPTKPVDVIVDGDGRNCFVTSLWSRRVTRVDLSTAKVAASIDLDFDPRECILLPDGQTLVVVDAFGGKLALIDTRSNQLIRRVEIPGHNMRGLALSPDGKDLLVTHMIVTESAATTRDNVFWGIAMTSNMRVIPIAALSDAGKNPVREAHTHFFGDPGNAAGDPDALAVLPDGTTLICLAGVGEVAIGRYYPYGFRRVSVGQRPTALVVDEKQKFAYVANAHSDSITVVDIERRSAAATISLGPGPVLSQVEEGERLFHDAKLSLDGWFSCHSCHTDGHSNGQRADTFGDGSYGAPKNVLTLLGTADTEPWAWNGSKKQLEDQVRESLRMTMQPKVPPGEGTVAALTAYMRSLASAPIADWQRRDAVAIERGERIFNARGCASCHAPPLYSNFHVYDVGLDDGEGGNRQFNPPSLRGLAHRATYFHDGRAKSLEAVFRVHQHRLRTALSDDDLSDLIAFLKSL